MKLELRPIKLKIKIAVIADALAVAAGNPFPKVDPDTTLYRFVQKHPYEDIWVSIRSAYWENNWHELSNQRLEEKLKLIATQGAKKLRYCQREWNVTPESIAEAAKRWVSYGWLNYEEKKAEKLKTATKIARWGALIAGGGSIFGL